MAVAQGFSKITTSGSVFMYDTADGVNSFKGKPTTNILQGISPGVSNTPPYFLVSYGTESAYIPGLGKSVTVNYCNIYNDYNGGSGQCCPSLFNYGTNFTTGVTGSTTYTYQIIYRTTDGYYSENYMYRYEYGPSGYITEGGLLSPSRMEDLGDGWIHGWGTFTTNAATTNMYGYLFHYQYATQNKVQVAGIMITQGSQVLRPNQFLPPQASRSNTQSLLPLISNSSLSVSDVSFNSVGTMTFDGTNDQIPVSANSIFNTNNFSVEAIFKLSTYDNEHRTVASRNASVYSHTNGWWMGTLRNGLGSGNNDFRFFMWGDSSYVTYATSNGANDGKYHQMVIACDGTNVFFYVDGQLVNTPTKPSGNLYSAAENMLIGKSSVGDYWAGEIPNLKFYNRGLTPGEVLNNYNHYKTKYNLP